MLENQQSIKDWHEETELPKDKWSLRSNIIDKYDLWCDSVTGSNEEKNNLIDIVISISLLSSSLGFDLYKEINSRMAKLRTRKKVTF